MSDDREVFARLRNESAEQALLGAILMNNVAFDRVEGLLPAHFSNAVHGRIFAAIQKAIGEGRVADPVTLRAFFDHERALEGIGGGHYLAQLAGAAVTIVNAGDYAMTIRELAVRRHVLTAAQEMAEEASRPDAEATAFDLLANFEGRLTGISDEMLPQEGMATAATAVGAALRVAEAVYKDAGKITGLATGFYDVDRILGGLQPTHMVVIAGRPAMGKTALATTIAVNVAKSEDERAFHAGEEPGVVAFFSHEMTHDQIGQRLLSMMSGVSFEQIRAGNVGHLEMGLLVDAGRDLERLPLVIDDKPASIPTMRLRLRRLARRRRPLLAIVDYLQLVRPNGRADSREQEVSEISKGLKALGMEFGIPVIAVCQLSRAPEQRDDPRPRLSDLRESGSIEQDADQVFFVFREEYYVEKREPVQSERQKDHEFAALKAAWEQKLAAVRGLAELDLAKNRHGRTRTFRLRYDGVRTLFQNLARE